MRQSDLAKIRTLLYHLAELEKISAPLAQLVETLKQAEIPFVGEAVDFVNQAARVRDIMYPAVTHADDGEAEVLQQLLPGEGAYVDIGAHEPVQGSNTWPFYEQGWRGVLVEPLPCYVMALLLARPGDAVVPVAAGENEGFEQLRVCGGSSSVVTTWDIVEAARAVVPVKPLRDILALYPQVRDNCRLCSVDVEGAERDVLLGVDWDSFTPDVFILEFNEYHPDRLGRDLSPNWSHLLTDHTYREVWRNDLNVIFLRGDIDNPLDAHEDPGDAADA